MNTMILTKTYDEPPVCEKEIRRFAACKSADSETAALLDACLREALPVLTYRVCYGEFPMRTDGDACDFGAFRVHSKQLARNLAGCKGVVLYAATVGVELDRLIARYGRLSPAKALLLQAIGAERIEALCDVFCADIAAERRIGTRPRFSPGYGDLPLETQTDIFAVLQPYKHIGLTLSDSLLMSPTKSVTAFVGLGGEQKPTTNPCGDCNKADCAFRGVL